MLCPQKYKQQLADLGCVFRQTVPEAQYIPDRQWCEPVARLVSIYSQTIKLTQVAEPTFHKKPQIWIMIITIKSRQWHSACVPTGINEAAEELPYVSSDFCSARHSSVTLLLLLDARLRIRGFRLSSVGKASKPFKLTMIYKMRLWKCHTGMRALGRKTPLPRFKTERSQTVNMSGESVPTLSVLLEKS